MMRCSEKWGKKKNCFPHTIKMRQLQYRSHVMREKKFALLQLIITGKIHAKRCIVEEEDAFLGSYSNELQHQKLKQV